MDREFAVLAAAQVVSEAWNRVLSSVREGQLGLAFKGLPGGPPEDGAVSPPPEPQARRCTP